jgi:hypothetical protein
MRQVLIIEDAEGVQGGVHLTCGLRALGHAWRLLATTSMPAYELAFQTCRCCGEVLA